MKQFEKFKDTVLNRIRTVFKGNLVSVILYGSSAKGSFLAGRSDINLLIVRKENKTAELAGLTRSFRLWKRLFNCAVPLVLTESEIRGSTDVYPAEYRDIKEHHKVLHGKDVFCALSVSDRFLRLELENQIKSRLIFLRSSFILHSRRPRILRQILVSTLSTLEVLLTNILKLKGIRPARDIRGILAQAQSALKFRMEACKTAADHKERLTAIRRSESAALFASFIGEMEKLAQAVDRFKTRK